MLNHFSRVQLFVMLWTLICQAPLSVGFSRQEYWSGLQCPPPGDLLDRRTEPVSLRSPALASRFSAVSTSSHALARWKRWRGQIFHLCQWRDDFMVSGQKRWIWTTKSITQSWKLELKTWGKCSQRLCHTSQMVHLIAIITFILIFLK